MRRSIAFLFHAPGLWLFYRERLPRRLVAANIVAIVLTVAAALAAFAKLGAGAAIATWASGHFVWGLVLAKKL